MGSKKGQVAVLVGIVLLVVMFIIMIVGFSINNVVQSLNDEFKDTDFNNESKAVMQDQADDYPSFLDGLFLLALGVALIGGIIGSYFVDESPVWLVLDVLFLIFLLIGAAAVSNVYEEFVTADDYSGYETQFPVINWVMSNTVLVIGAFVAIMMTTIIIKQRTLV